MLEIIKLLPIAKERPWGGSFLKKSFNIKINKKIGEYWVLSSHPNGKSVIANGKFKGKDIDYLTSNFPDIYLGNSPQKRFPLLLKFLETTENLSVQIHPDDYYALKNENDYGKTECWYILKTEKKSEIIYNHKFKNKEEFLNTSLTRENIRKYLQFFPIKKNQTIFIPSKTIHALLSNTILIEIQQTSDVTYRIYDWDRKDKEKRPLHLKQAGELLDYNKNISPYIEPIVIFKNKNVKHEKLIKCSYFTVEKITLSKSKYTITGDENSPTILVNINGKCNILAEKSITKFLFPETVLLPVDKRKKGNSTKYTLYSNTNCTLLKITY